MIATDVVRAVLHALLAALIFTDVVEIWHLVVIEALFGTAEAFFRPAYTGLLPRTVPERRDPGGAGADEHDEQPRGAHRSGTGDRAGARGGRRMGVPARRRDVRGERALPHPRAGGQAPPPAEERRTLLAELAEGFEHVRSRSWLWVTVVVFALAVPLGNAPLFVLGPTVAENSYDSAALFGIVTTMFGAGAVAGALAGLRWRPRHPMRAAFLVLAGWPAFLVVFGAAAPVAIVLVLAFGMGVGFALFDVLWNTAMAERIPAHALSRVSSYDWMGSLVLLPVGFLVAGPARRGDERRDRDGPRRGPHRSGAGARADPARDADAATASSTRRGPAASRPRSSSSAALAGSTSRRTTRSSSSCTLGSPAQRALELAPQPHGREAQHLVAQVAPAALLERAGLL